MGIDVPRGLAGEVGGGVTALAARHMPNPSEEHVLDWSGLTQELSRWIEGGDAMEWLSHCLAHDCTCGPRGIFRFYGHSENAMPLPQSFPLASWASKLKRSNKVEAANLLYRLSFARGETDLRADDAIEKMTEQVLQSGIHIDVAIRGVDQGSRTRRLETVQDVRYFLENAVGSRMTIMDFVEACDIASPIVPLTGIELHLHRLGPFSTGLEVVGSYGGPYSLSLSFNMDAVIGTPSILFRTINVDPRAQRSGIGTRSLLQLALLAQRHGIKRWREAVHQDGLYVWPRLGACLDRENKRLQATDDVKWFDYTTQEVLARLLDQYLPERLFVSSIADHVPLKSPQLPRLDRERMRKSLHHTFRQGLQERHAVRVVDAELARQEMVLRGPMQAPEMTTCNPAVFEQGLPMAPAALMAVGGMVYRPVR